MFQRLKGERVAARDALRTLAEAEPKIAAYQLWYGTAIFESMNDIGMFSKMSWAGTGRDALIEAAKLNPNDPLSRFGLVQFYANAPGIAGGSYTKATEQAQAMLKIPEGKGQFMGYLALATIASLQEEWAEACKQYALAETATGTGASAEAALRSHVYTLLVSKKDPDAALPVIERLAAVAKPDDTAAPYFRGMAKQQQKQYAAAIENYLTVLALSPEARNTRYSIAQCYEAISDDANALLQYEEFVRRFPDHDNASTAKAAVKKLKKKLKK